MKSQPVSQSEEYHPNMIKGILIRVGEILAGFIVLGTTLFLSAGRVNWVWGWIMLGIYLVSVGVNGIFMLRRSPETIAERGQPGEMKPWDRLIGGLWGAVQYILVPLTAGLDERFVWSGEISLGWQVAGAAVFTGGLGLLGWAMITNVYFSTAVRIQSDRGHTVCRSGPYRFVRHPGYAGAILQSLGIPFLLGTFWALVPGLIAAALMVIRTALEDRMLQAELPGYLDFVRDVRYRLVPGVW